MCSINWFDKVYILNLPVKRDSRFDRSRANRSTLRKGEHFTIQKFSSLNFKHFYKQFLSLCCHYLAYTCSSWHRETELLDHAAGLLTQKTDLSGPYGEKRAMLHVAPSLSVKIYLWQFNNQLPVALLAQLVRCAVHMLLEVRVRVLASAWFFSGFFSSQITAMILKFNFYLF